MPKNCKDFLRVDQNKTEIVGVLSREVILLPTTDDKELYAIRGTEILFFPAESDLTSLTPCPREEVDTRMLLGVADAVQKGVRTVAIRTVDTDVVVLFVASFNDINRVELWIAFGTGSSFQYIAVHQLAATINSRQCDTLPIFHALTGCHTVSSFAGRGKKTAWEIWKVFPEVNDAFEELVRMSMMSLRKQCHC